MDEADHQIPLMMARVRQGARCPPRRGSVGCDGRDIRDTRGRQPRPAVPERPRLPGGGSAGASGVRRAAPAAGLVHDAGAEPAVATGRRAAYVTDGGDLSGSVHFAVGIALCRAAGCVVTGIDGAALGPEGRGLAAAADADTHARLMSMIRSLRSL